MSTDHSIILSWMLSSRDSGHSFMKVERGISNGFWGPVDSLMDWCEPNYVITPYIAEFFNTLSSIPMIIWALIGIIYTYKYCTKEKKYIMAFLVLFCVGSGSVAFHGTLRFHAQLLDELPMMMGDFVLLYCCIEAESPKASIPLAILFLFFAILEIVLYVVYQWWFIFLLGYAVGVFAQVVICYTRIRSYSSLLRKIFYASVILYFVAFTLWFSENAFCPHVQKWQLHAIWHLGAGYGVYLWILSLIIMRCEFLKKKPQIRITQPIPCAHYVMVKVED